MSGKDLGWLLPDTLTGHDLLCVTLKIPNNLEYRAAFMGALHMLEVWFNWEKTGDTRAAQAAAYWRELTDAYLTIGEDCPLVDVRQNEETPCILEKTSDGITWSPFADLQLCPPDVVMIGGILYVNTPGVGYTPVGQQTPATAPQQPPPRPRAGSAEDNRCNAAANAMQAIVLLNDAVRQPVLDGKNIFEIAAAVLQVIALIVDNTPFSSLIMPAVQDVINDFDMLSAVYSEADKQDLQCLLYNDSSDDAGIVTFDFAQVLLDLNSDSRLTFRLAEALLALIGESGLNYAASASTISGAVCACDGWALQQFNGFGDAQIEYVSEVTASGFPPTTATYNGTFDRAEGQIVSNGSNQMCGAPLQITLPEARTLTRIALSWQSDDSVPGEIVTDLHVYDASNNELHRAYSIINDGSYNLEGLSIAGAKRIYLYVRSYYGSLANVTRFLIAGTGTNPFV